MAVTESASERLLLLPIWAGMDDDDVERVIDAVHSVLGAQRGAGVASA
jgi:dTDP-4-amino-4,6-dideoxygalactose transaminase